MVCPECAGEYREGITVCPECEVALVERLPPPRPHDLMPFVTVFETADPAILPLLRSLLDGTDIPYTIRNEEALGLFPAAHVGLAVDPYSHAAEVLVPDDRAEEARALLAEIDQDAGEAAGAWDDEGETA